MLRDLFDKQVELWVEKEDDQKLHLELYASETSLYASLYALETWMFKEKENTEEK